MENFHALTVEEAIKTLQTDRWRGLTETEAAARLVRYGRNELPQGKKRSIAVLILKQFRSGLTQVLLVAAAASFFVGEINDALAILIAVFVNAVFGFAQERRAEQALTKLQAMVVPEATVVRGGLVRRFPAAEVVPGDLLIIQEGDRVAADARLIESKSLRADESALSGESRPVNKSVPKLPPETPANDQHDIVRLGTTVIAGTGTAVVVATGQLSSFGRIAASLAEIEQKRTPFEEHIGRLGRKLGILSIILAAVIAAIGMIRGYEIMPLFLFAVAMAVAVIPEGLPAVLAAVLAIGVRRMAKRQAIIRHMPSVETLGVADVICTDKTGTLTENKMTVREFVLSGLDVAVSGEGWETGGEFSAGGRPIRPTEVWALDALLETAVACARATLEWRNGRPMIVGDATEGALIVAAAKAGIDQRRLQDSHRRLDEIVFSSERKFRAVFDEIAGPDGRRFRRLFVVGAFDVVVARSAAVQKDGSAKPLDQPLIDHFEEANASLAGRALRVVAAAYKDMPADQESISADDVAGLTLLGLAGMIDPPRAGAADALERCRRAGIRTIMVTGDHRATALAIGREIGLIGSGPNDGIFDETEVAGLSDAEFADRLKRAVVFARVSPQTKLRIVRGLQQMGHVVAMTGDGVNDAPALKQADIGIAMGRSGTDVSREAADMILADDNFVTIVNAVEEGRVVFRNVKQTTVYLFVHNIAEIITMLAALIVALPLPLLAGQILWMNLVTDGLPSIALATEPAHEGVLARPPRARGSKFLTRYALGLTAVISFIMCLGSLGLFIFTLERTGDLDIARSVVFTAMVVFQIWNVSGMRTTTASLFRVGWFTNPYVIWAIVLSLGLQGAVLYLPFMRSAFETAALGWFDWLLILLVTSSAFWAIEAYKLAYRRGWLPRAWI